VIDLAHFRGRLVDLRAALVEEARHGEESARPVELDQSRVGRVSRMDAMQGQAMAQESSRRRDRRIRQIDAALGRIEDGSYGGCLRCGEPIASGRLESDPSATLCIGCAAADER